MNLEKIDPVHLESLKRPFELPPSARIVTLVGLGRDEHSPSVIRKHFAVVEFGILIKGSGIEVVDPELERPPDDPDGGVASAVKGAFAAEPEDGDGNAGSPEKSILHWLFPISSAFRARTP
jgi:hypothetical protein